MPAITTVKIGWRTLIQPLLGILLIAGLSALIYQRGMMDGAAGVYEKQLTEMTEWALAVQENSEKALQDGLKEGVDKMQRDDYFKDSKAFVTDFYAQREPLETTSNAAPNSTSCSCTDIFDADELRLFNEGNRASDFDRGSEQPSGQLH